MLRFICLFVTFMAGICQNSFVIAGLPSAAVREASEGILKKFGKGGAGQTVDEIAAETSEAVAKHGDEALPLLRHSGHAGFNALQFAGPQADDVIKLYARRGDEAVWIISEPKKLAIFLRHGDSAADALLKHPGIADDLLERYGDDAIGALNSLSRPQAQRLSMMAGDGTLDGIGQRKELLDVVARHGDKAMDFVWRNKGALATTALLAKFLSDPDAYINGMESLIVDPVVEPIVKKTNWTLVILASIGVFSLPLILPTVVRVLTARRRPTNRANGT